VTEYIITHTYGNCPNQIEGHTDDGQHFYFRGRLGQWSLHFGKTPEETTFGEGYDGVDEKAGWYNTDEWESFFWQVIADIEAGYGKELDVKEHKKATDEFLAKTFPPFAPILKERKRIVKQLEDELGIGVDAEDTKRRDAIIKSLIDLIEMGPQ